MAVQFTKATKRKARARISLAGPPGSGKTYTALTFASVLGERIAVIDTERGSASKYANDFAFDTLDLESFEPARYIEAIEAAAAAGYDVVVIDSLSHAWAGKGGILELVDRETKDSRSKDSYHVGWKKATPVQNRFVDAILQAPMHVIATMRTKMEYAIELQNGRPTPTKIGLAPVQRDGVEYEFDIVGDLDQNQVLRITKTRCSELTGAVIERPGKAVAETIKAWLSEGPPAQERIERPAPAPARVDPAEPGPGQPYEARAARVERLPAEPETVIVRSAAASDEFDHQHRLVHLMRALAPAGFKITTQQPSGRVTFTFPKGFGPVNVVRLDTLTLEDMDVLERKLKDQLAARAAGGGSPASPAPSPRPEGRPIRTDSEGRTATGGSRGSRGEPPRTREPGDDDVPY